MRRYTVKPIVFKGVMSPQKLKRYAKDPDIFVIFNTHETMKRIYAKMKTVECPPYDECYRTRPFKCIYDRAIKSPTGIGLEALSYNIDIGKYVLFRIEED